MPYVCIGVPFALGKQQTPSAVDVLKHGGIAAEFNAEWIDIQPDFAAHDDPVVAVNRALADAIAAHPGHTPLIFASDCTSALGAVKGLQPRDPAVLWYDAHGDFNTPETSPSGYLGGMPLAAMVGRGNEALVQAIGFTPLAERDILITDARDLDPQEGVNLRASQMTFLPNFADLLTAPLPTKPLYIHMDVDVVDPSDIPAQNYPAPGGPSVDEAAASMQRVIRDATVAGVLFSLWDESLSGADVARENTLKLIRALEK
ncbi:MAG: arginase family protein [bacterium]|nr:arginase family protein [bacterium]